MPNEPLPPVPIPEHALSRTGLARMEEFLDLYTQHRGHLFGHILALVGQAAAAEEVLQETSLLLWREFDRFQPGTNFRAWARQVALNCVRASRRQRLPVFNDELVRQIAEDRARLEDRLDDRAQRLQQCVGKLPAADQQLVEDYYAAGATADELAARQGKSASAIRKAIKRIRRALFACVGRGEPA